MKNPDSTTDDDDDRNQSVSARHPARIHQIDQEVSHPPSSIAKTIGWAKVSDSL